MFNQTDTGLGSIYGNLGSTQSGQGQSQPYAPGQASVAGGAALGQWMLPPTPGGAGARAAAPNAPTQGFQLPPGWGGLPSLQANPAGASNQTAQAQAQGVGLTPTGQVASSGQAMQLPDQAKGRSPQPNIAPSAPIQSPSTIAAQNNASFWNSINQPITPPAPQPVASPPSAGWSGLPGLSSATPPATDPWWNAFQSWQSSGAGGAPPAPSQFGEASQAQVPLSTAPAAAQQATAQAPAGWTQNPSTGLYDSGGGQSWNPATNTISGLPVLGGLPASQVPAAAPAQPAANQPLRAPIFQAQPYLGGQAGQPQAAPAPQGSPMNLAYIIALIQQALGQTQQPGF